MKLTQVTSLQQSQEFIIATHRAAVNYGKNVGPDLIDWSCEPHRLGTGGIGAVALSGMMQNGPDFILPSQAATVLSGHNLS